MDIDPNLCPPPGAQHQLRHQVGMLSPSGRSPEIKARIEGRVRDIENKYDAQLAALASRCETPASDSEDEIEHGDGDSEEGTVNAAKREKIYAEERDAESSLEALNHPEIKVSFL